MIQLTSQDFSVNCPFRSITEKTTQAYTIPLLSSVTVSQLLMDIKHRAEEIQKHNWVSGHLQGRSLSPYICVRTHNCHKITCHYWADRMDSTYCCLMASFFKNAVSPVFKDNAKEDAGVLSCPPSCPPSTPSFQWKQGSAYSVTFQTLISVCDQLVRADSLKGSH